MSRFDSLREERAARGRIVRDATTAHPSPAGGRAGKKAVSAYFSPEVSRALHLLALEQGVSLQALMGEAFDDLMRKYGKHPLGER